MKQMKLVLVVLLSLMVTNVAFADEQPFPVEKLPAAAKRFVKTHFQGQSIIEAEKDWNTFECRLSDGTEIDFTKKGMWKKVDCQKNAVPAELIPAAIQQYVKDNFADCIITKIDKENYGYEIGLSNDLDLKFNENGGLIGMDD